MRSRNRQNAFIRFFTYFLLQFALVRRRFVGLFQVCHPYRHAFNEVLGRYFFIFLLLYSAIYQQETYKQKNNSLFLSFWSSRYENGYPSVTKFNLGMFDRFFSFQEVKKFRKTRLCTFLKCFDQCWLMTLYWKTRAIAAGRDRHPQHDPLSTHRKTFADGFW